MTISYNWLSEYLPEQIEPERLSKILTSIGLEVESLHPYTPVTEDGESPSTEGAEPYTDYIIEIGLTPNHMDAMSHYGVARDVCAYLTHHNKKDLRAKYPSVNAFKVANHSLPISVTIENTDACQRYSAVSISGVTVGDSPQWLKDRLKAIGLRSINNIVDITNFVLHETGQPLHAFDADAITGNQVIVKNLPEGTPFVTLDEKERKLSAEDLMICNATEGMCIAGVFGGVSSGVTEKTKNIFLESAWFNPVAIRKTSVRHGLRTDAATRFEKGVDISNTVTVLKRAALLIKELAGGEIASDLVDVYPQPKEKTTVGIKYHYLKKLSGKNYHPDAIKKILEALGFEIEKDSIDELRVAVPYNKPDITLPADIVEEIVRIDGLDNIDIPSTITISPSVEESYAQYRYKSKVAQYLIGAGFSEILTNSITNSAYYTEEVLQHTVKMLNNLSADLNVLRPSMLETGLESVAWNLNRKNNQLRFFEQGKVYSTTGVGQYTEQERLCLFVSGNKTNDGWQQKAVAFDIYYLKGMATGILQVMGIKGAASAAIDTGVLQGLEITASGKQLGIIGSVAKNKLDQFDIKQPVFVADFNWQLMADLATKNKIRFKELPKQLPVQRDLAIVVAKTLPYENIEKAVKQVKINKLQSMQLFDIFESEKLGAGKKSLAISFSFLDEEKTLTDKEIDGMMQKIISAFETTLEAEVRK